MIVWAQSKAGLEEGTIHVLDSYTGPRVYEKDKLDGRLTMTENFGEVLTLPFFDNWIEAKSFMCDNPGKQVQITTVLGKQLGLL